MDIEISNEVIKTDRRRSVERLFGELARRKYAEDRSDLVEIAYQLLISDPMSIQEAGVVARAVRELSREVENHLNWSEWVELLGGDFLKAESIFDKSIRRLAIWQQALLGRIDSNNQVYLFREMNVDLQVVEKIRTEGLDSRGIKEYGGVKGVLVQKMRSAIIH